MMSTFTNRLLLLTKMIISWSIVLASFAAVASAQALKDCGAPSTYEYTRLSKKYLSRQKYSHGEKVYYDCAQDYTPSKGKRAIECIDGKWSQLSLKCQKKSCGNAGDLPNGEFVYLGNLLVGDRVKAVCKPGYILKGEEYLICKHAVWTGEYPTCEAKGDAVVPPEVTCSSPVVANGTHSATDGSRFSVGDVLTFKCNQGYKMDGAQQAMCSSEGQWQPQPPKCRPPSGCGVPTTLRDSKAVLTGRYITRTSFGPGERVRYTCETGYEHAGGRNDRICLGGKWTSLRLKCERKSCGSAGEITNGHFIYTGAEFGDTATAVCNEGFELVGRGTRRCMAGGWDGRVPECEVVQCLAPPATNAEPGSPLEEFYVYRSVISYRCRHGTLVGQSEIWCTSNGKWSTQPPKCQDTPLRPKITCPPVRVMNSARTGALREPNEVGDTVSFICDKGFRIRGDSTVFCGTDGQWYPELPTCIYACRSWWHSRCVAWY